MNETIVAIALIIYTIFIISLSCYLAINYSLWWLLLLLLCETKIRNIDDKEDEGDK